MSHQWFRRELDCMLPDGSLRLVRDPHRLGLDLWVVERRVPAKEHATMLEMLRANAWERYMPLFIDGVQIQYDTAPEWKVVHICKTTRCEHQPVQFSVHDPECYREPNAADIASLRRWLFEFRNFEESAKALQREEKERKAALDKEENLIIRKDLKSSKKFRQLRYSFAGDGHGTTTESIDENHEQH